jgi:hypothetical protein
VSEEQAQPRRRGLALRVFLWTLVVFAVLLGALMLLSRSDPDQPFTYAIQ